MKQEIYKWQKGDTMCTGESYVKARKSKECYLLRFAKRIVSAEICQENCVRWHLSIDIFLNKVKLI
jgi:hypothetical protein